MATAKAIQDAFVLALATEGIVSGSVIVNEVEANDVDVFTPYPLNNDVRKAYGLEEYFTLDVSPEYEQAQIYKEITNVYRAGEINLIVVHPTFWFAYLVAHQKLQENPEEYLSKKDRANLFIRMKNSVHKALGNSVRPLQE